MRDDSMYATFTKWVARFCGRPTTFLLALALVLAWIVSGPLFGFSDTWQLVINTGTTIVTFLMVFVIQSTQNRDTAAIQIKLDELIRATQGAHNALLDLEELDEAALEQFRRKYEGSPRPRGAACEGAWSTPGRRTLSPRARFAPHSA
jgi:low affinity Fe/Cu permease